MNEVLSIPSSEIALLPRVSKGEGSRFVREMGKAGDAVEILLDPSKLLDDSETGSSPEGVASAGALRHVVLSMTP